MVTGPEGIELAAAAVGVGAGLWAATRWLLWPRLRAAIREALAPELAALTAMERGHGDVADRLELVEERLALAETRVREHDALRGTVEQLAASVRHSIVLQEQSLGKIAELAVAVGEVRGELRARRGEGA